MIYTLTLSPSVDLVIENGNFQTERVNRYSEFSLFPGGKGINASVVLKRHDFSTKAISFFDKASLSSFEQLFEAENLYFINIEPQSKTRINIKFYGENTDFELNGPRTTITQQQKETLFKELSKINSNDTLLIMGAGEDSLMIEILEFIKNKGISFVLDVDSQKLKDFIAYKPYLIKPNKDELQRNFSLKTETEKDIIHAMLKIQQMGSKNIIVSMDKSGSLLLTENKEVYRATIINKIEVVSATGAGDTMISVFAANYLKSQDPIKSFALANAAAMGTVSSNWLTNKQLTEKFLNNVKVEKVV
ncbi:1-phosphofructokinase [Mycoplasma procyoni]|uniref:1-phosphofructokinase n=1 Tax=Mycoplasma procyoni TaxID=568784 RepID=UPI00197C0253|nr:1-phosphofructokinase family hexose kinase [Mycoplasma procyoni]MBN3534781.1 1-phosphofructokinase family hexose kinase [Mycoplasma procyoni]